MSGQSTTMSLGIARNPERCDIVSAEANLLAPLRGEFSAMAKRRFQAPTPFCEGRWWWISPWQDEFKEGRLERRRKRMKVCPAETPERGLENR
jgi:hypothetical protein